MRHKGPIWTIIFVIIIIFVLTNTLDMHGYFQAAKIDIISEDGFSEEKTITTIDQPQQREGTLYQQFRLQTAPRENTASITVSDNWLRQEGIAPESVIIYHQARDGEEWEEKTITSTLSFSDSTTYTVQNMHSGNYYIIGQPGTAPTAGTSRPSITLQLGIMIITITLLLFIAYHHHSSREVRKHEKKKPGQADLDKYIKKSLLAGHDEKAITERLVQAGWSEQQVTQGIRRARFF